MYSAISTPGAEVEASRVEFDHRPAQNRPSNHVSSSDSDNYTSENDRRSTRSQQSQDSHDSVSQNGDSEDSRTSAEETWLSIETERSEQLQKPRRRKYSEHVQKPHVNRGRKSSRVRYWWRKVSFKRARTLQ